MERQSGPDDDPYGNAALSPPTELGAGATTRPWRVAFVLSEEDRSEASRWARWRRVWRREASTS